MIDAGELPYIARILEEGVSGELESEIPPITPPAWTSMMTGVNPGKHGIFHFIRRELGSYRCPLNDSSHFSGMDIGSILSRQDWKVGLLNVPMTFPPYPVNGWTISGVPCPLESDSIFSSPSLAEELQDLLGHPYESDVNYVPWDGDTEPNQEDLSQYASLRDELFRLEKERLELLPILLQRHPVDFFFTVISITDRCQHFFWKFQDRSHAGWSEEGERLYGEVIREAYHLADAFVGKVIELVGSAVPIAIVSDHGFGPQNWDFHVNRWLEEEEFLYRKPTPRWVLNTKPVSRFPGFLGKVPFPRLRRKSQTDFEDVDWSRTRAFSSLDGICLNIKGREPNGLVPEEQAQPLLNEIRHRLKKLTMPGGRKAVDWFVDLDECYSGNRKQEAPDLQFQMGGLTCLLKDDWNSKTLFSERRNAGISGTHRFEGIFALSAPGVKPSQKLSGMHIRDTTPTLFHALGIPIPSWMEGKAQSRILSKRREVVIVEESMPIPGGAGVGFTQQDSEKVEESLRALGYLQ